MDTFSLDFDSLKAFCARRELKFAVNDEAQHIVIPHHARPGWAVRIVAHKDRGMVTIAYPLPGTIPPDRVGALTLAAAILNSHTYLGAWVVNPETREMYFRQTMLADGLAVTDEGLWRLLQIVIGTVDRVLPKLDGVLKGAEPDTVVG